MALVDADYKFLWVEVGSNGSASDAQVFNAGLLKKFIESGDINFPSSQPLPNDDKDMPYFIIGDDAFALRTWMMKPKRSLSREDIFSTTVSRGLGESLKTRLESWSTGSRAY